MKKLTHDEISQNRSSLDSLHKVKRLPVYVILNSIRSNYNVGSIFRTSDGAMIEKLFLCGLATDFCVSFSAQDAAVEGFEVVVFEDACRAIDLDGSLATAKTAMLEAGVEFRNAGP